jgi:transposase InsO family protein
LCLKIKTRAPVSNGLLKPIETKRPFELIGIDIAYLPISNGGYRYVLVAIDYFTNWVEAALLKSMSAEEIIRAFFKIIIAQHGCPERFHSDSGSTFVSQAIHSLCDCFNIKKEESSP